MNVIGVIAMLGIGSVLAWSLRRTTLWPLALPITLAFGEAGFVQTWDLAVPIPGFPVPWSWRDIVFASLIVAWLLVRRVSAPENRSPALVRLDAAPLAAWLALVAIAIPLAWIDGGQVKIGIAWVVSSYAYVPLCFLLLWDILRRTDRPAMWTLLRALSVVVTVLAIFYVFHMLGLSLYDAAGVNSTYFYAEGVRRDILTFPVWACLTIPFLLWSERIRVHTGVMIVIQAAAVAMSVTRSLVLACVVAVVVVALGRIATRRRPLQPLVPVAVGLAGLGTLAIAAPRALGRIVDPLLSRFDELAAGVTSVATMTQRLGVGERVSSFLSGWSLWMGAGFSDAALAQSRANIGSLLVADSLWSLVLLHFGVIGAIVVGVTLAVGLGAGVLATYRRRAQPMSLAIVGTAGLAWLVARTAASSEILTNYPIVCALVLALVMVEARDAWAKAPDARRLLLDRDDAPVLPSWARGNVLLTGGAIAILIVIEIVIGRMMAR